VKGSQGESCWISLGLKGLFLVFNNTELQLSKFTFLRFYCLSEVEEIANPAEQIKS